MHAAGKKLNEMNRLGDMAHFPAIVNAGATLNIVLTIIATWAVQPHFHQLFAPALWIAAVLCLNLLPVVLLRLTITSTTCYPTLSGMDFVRDQHKFSDWVYLAASANMAFWVLGSWAVFSVSNNPGTLVTVLAVAFLSTFSPVLLRGFSGNGSSTGIHAS